MLPLCSIWFLKTYKHNLTASEKQVIPWTQGQRKTSFLYIYFCPYCSFPVPSTCPLMTPLGNTQYLLWLNPRSLHGHWVISQVLPGRTCTTADPPAPPSLQPPRLGLSLLARRSHFRKLWELAEKTQTNIKGTMRTCCFVWAVIRRGARGWTEAADPTTHRDVSLPRERVEFSARRGGNSWVRNCRAVLKKSSCHHERRRSFWKAAEAWWDRCVRRETCSVVQPSISPCWRAAENIPAGAAVLESSTGTCSLPSSAARWNFSRASARMEPCASKCFNLLKSRFPHLFRTIGIWL